MGSDTYTIEASDLALRMAHDAAQEIERHGGSHCEARRTFIQECRKYGVDATPKIPCRNCGRVECGRE